MRPIIFGVTILRLFRRVSPLSPRFYRSLTAMKSTASDVEDPYIWLEEVESEESLAFAKKANEACLEALGDPSKDERGTGTYKRILQVLESDDRIPHVSRYGKNGDKDVLINFWKDSKNPKGLWRKTTLESYKKDRPEWETILDIDELSDKDGISWVWKGNRPLARGRDPEHSSDAVTRSLLLLSRGGSDATFIKEFDMSTGLVEDRPFNLPEAKTRASYKSRNVLLVGSDFGPDTLTDSGYPRTVREWVRGTKIEDAPVIFEGEATDVSVSAYISDERTWGGSIYEIQSRSMTFYTSKYWMRGPLQFEHLLAPDDPAKAAVGKAPDFKPVDVPDDAEIDFLGKLLVITLRSDWAPVPNGDVYKRGSVIYVNAESFFENGSASCVFRVLFAPTEHTAFEYYTATKNYLIVSTKDTVKSKLDFFKIGDGTLDRITNEKESEAQIRSVSVRPVDPWAGSDEFWYTTSDYLSPSTLYLADASRVENNPSSDSKVFIKEKLKTLPDMFDSSEMQVEQRFATSLDGTKIPYFIVMHKNTVLNGKTPTLLYGYGGFEVSLGPHYAATAGIAWLERGGAYIEANIRGGGEFGPAWHQAGSKAKRHKCYEDFIAVAEHLIASNICEPKTLAVRGGSNGGLLVANMYTMRPDLFGAIHCAVPLIDMKRFHTLLAGASWMAEYGNPDTDDWDFLKNYSPYHNIDENADYPPILVTTSTRDDRVHPAHARKFVKKLEDIGGGRWPVHYYENIEGGHGGAADAKQSAFMTSLAMDFMFDVLSRNAAK